MAQQQPIAPDKIYTLDALKASLGVADGWLRSARRAGLRSLRVGGRGFFYGRDVIEYINRPDHEVETVVADGAEGGAA